MIQKLKTSLVYTYRKYLLNLPLFYICVFFFTTLNHAYGSKYDGSPLKAQNISSTPQCFPIGKNLEFLDNHLTYQKNIYPLDSIEAWAISLEKQAQSGVYIKEWSKKELNEKPVPSIPSLFSMFSSKIAEFLNNVGQADAKVSTTSGLKKIYSAQVEDVENKEKWLWEHAKFERVPSQSRLKSDTIISHLNSMANETLYQKISVQIPLLNQFKGGLSFDLGLPSSSVKERRTSPSIQKYGLILEEIDSEISPISDEHFFLVNNFDNSLYVESKSQVKWTIGPIEEKKQLRFDVDYDEFTTINEQTSWNKFDLPSFKFKGNISPASRNLQLYMKKENPGFVVSATQAENLYKITYTSGNASVPDKFLHTIKIPIVGTLDLARVYDSDGKTLETSASGILIADNLPEVGIHHFNLKNNILASLSQSANGHTFKLITEQSVTEGAQMGKDIKVSIDYAFNF